MHGIERDGLLLGVGPALHGSRFIGPGCSHGHGECAQAAHRVSPCQVQIQVHIRQGPFGLAAMALRSEEHTSELQSLMRISYAVFCLKKKKTVKKNNENTEHTSKPKYNRHTISHSHTYTLDNHS